MVCLRHHAAPVHHIVSHAQADKRKADDGQRHIRTGEADEVENIPDEVREDVDKQDTARLCTGGHRAHHIGLPLFDFSPCLNQFDDPKHQGSRHCYHHGEHTVAPSRNEDDQVGNGRDGGNRVQHAL